MFRVKRKSGLAREELINGYLFALPAILGFILFFIGPLVASLYLSFCRYSIVKSPVWIGLDNYRRAILKDDLFWKSMYNTVYYSGFGIPLKLLVALAIALLLNQKLIGKSIFRTIIFLPVIVPVIASAMIWLWIFNPGYGLLNALLGKVGISGPGWLSSPVWCKPALIIMSIWGLGIPMIIFLAGLQGIPEELYDAAKIDGATSWHRFRSITIPMLSPTIFFNSIIGIIGSFQIFTEVYVMGSAGYYSPIGGPLNALLFYVLYLYQNAFEFFQMGYASALAWLLLIIIFILTLVQFKFASKWVYYETRD